MYEVCPLINAVCAFCGHDESGQRCGIEHGENHTNKMKKCPLQKKDKK